MFTSYTYLLKVTGHANSSENMQKGDKLRNFKSK